MSQVIVLLLLLLPAALFAGLFAMEVVEERLEAARPATPAPPETPAAGAATAASAAAAAAATPTGTPPATTSVGELTGPDRP